MNLLRVMRWSVVLLASMFPAWPGFAGDTAEIGGRSGPTYNQECGGESLVIGFEYNSGKSLDSMGAICGIRANGDWTGEIVHKGRVGGGGGSGPFTILCPPFNAVAGIQVFIDNNDSVRHFGIGCFPVPGPELTYLGTNNEGGEDQYDVHSDCPPFQFATGVYGHFEALVNSMGLHCMAPVIKAAAPPPPPLDPPTPPTKTETPAKVDNEPTEDPVIPAGGDQTTAATDTTVYKVQGEDDPNTNNYLNRGDQVTIVSCGDGWCKISAPYSGWVWGEDLGR